LVKTCEAGGKDPSSVELHSPQ